MTIKERILVVDDEPANIRLLGEILSDEGYDISVARDGEEALAQIERARPHLVLLDVVMPGMSGYDVCSKLRANEITRLLPIILVTGARPEDERVRGLDAGADEFLTKPVNREEMLARVRGLLRIEALHRDITEWNSNLEARVQEQVEQIKRLDQIKSFLPQHVAEVVAEGNQHLLEPQRRNITVAAIDLRGFTAFSDTAEPEEIMGVLSEYYSTMGEITECHGGAVEAFAGDGMVIFFNAPLEIENHELCAVRAALEMQDAFKTLQASWTKQGHQLGFGIGISNGYATIGAVGFAGRWQYAAIGSVTNLSARLCSDAKDGEILLTSRVHLPIETQLEVEQLGEKTYKGFHKPIPVMAAVKIKAEQDA
jgi:adenylate cyclase